MKQVTEKSFVCIGPQIKRDRIKRFSRKSVLKMLAVMEASQSAAGNSNSASQVPAVTPEEAAANEKEFLSSGRTGRRNALPDILGQHAVVSSEDLSGRLQGLTTNDTSIDKRNQPGCSKS
ncbi:unnamed protein product [Psylliodes chrysocephalus]|uniref:cAMP-dependent protein kinase inhibitor beta n=1 Tax=Psylliodes chrysocephalus TaxID=3402493 RepID=A0A9P0G6F2_9CUCU|nr:unnamed protein product [Psylliodes chrysocephala]